MPTPTENLIAAYIKAVMKEKDLRPTDVINASKRIKKPIASSTFQQIYSGGTPNPGIYTLADISSALGRPFEEMLNAALGGSVVESSTFTKSKFALLAQLYEEIQGRDKKIADRFVGMLEREFNELLREQDQK